MPAGYPHVRIIDKIYMKARLKSSGFLKRIFHIETAERNYEIIYEGGNIGYESVHVNGLLVVKKRAWLWMTPTFDFMIGSLPARIFVSFWPWLSIQSFWLTIGNKVIYSEGSDPKTSVFFASPAGRVAAALIFWFICCQVTAVLILISYLLIIVF
jgi:hypothetical protein